jgi:hypothetical protein
MPQSDGATAQAQDKAQEVAGQAKEQAQQAAGQAKEQVRTQVDERSTQAGEQVSQQASDIRTVAEKLREEGKDGPAKVADQAAERIEKVGSYLTQSDADRILSDVEDFARQKPMAVIAGGIALGFMASRFLKASQGERYQSRTGGEQRFSRDTPATQPTGYSIPSAAGTGLSATPDNELSTGVPPTQRPQTTPPVPQTPATAPVTGGI